MHKYVAAHCFFAVVLLIVCEKCVRVCALGMSSMFFERERNAGRGVNLKSKWMIDGRGARVRQRNTIEKKEECKMEKRRRRSISSFKNGANNHLRCSAALSSSEDVIARAQQKEYKVEEEGCAADCNSPAQTFFPNVWKNAARVPSCLSLW